jgi:hypothetical protein
MRGRVAAPARFGDQRHADAELAAKPEPAMVR